MNQRVLVVDDEAAVRAKLEGILTERGLQVVEASGAEQALEAYRNAPFEVVLADVDAARRPGTGLVEEIRQLDPAATVVVLTDESSSTSAAEALEQGAYDYLFKPLATPDAITNAIERALERARLVEQNRILVDHVSRNAELLEGLGTQLTDIANHDPLTGLYNHRFLMETLSLEARRAQRHDRSFSLIITDVDDFGHYTATHGELAGDELLRTLARLLEAECRDTTVIARFGADEFALVVPEVPGAGALSFAEKLARAAEMHPFTGRESQPGGKVTLCLGVAVFPAAGRETARMLDSASTALEWAKQAGRNTVSIWEQAKR